jgi:hypothetical protein
MLPKRRISSRDFVNDIRTGMSDTELMQKYQLSSRGLQSIFAKLLEAKALDPSEIYERSSFGDSTVDVEIIHQSLLGYAAMTASIYETRNPTVMGTIHDLTEKRLEVRGIEAGFGETKTFIILTDKAAKMEPIMIKAKCRWCKKEESTGDYLAGFEITHLSEEDQREFRKLLRAIKMPQAD